MTVKVLKKLLTTMPNNAELIFAIWGLEGDKHTLFEFKAGNNMVHETTDSAPAVIVGTADYSKHKIKRKGDKLQMNRLLKSIPQ